MKAMIFAAGLGTRLKPLTDTMPKALVPVDGKPLLEILMKKLKASGFTDVVINVHHFAEQIIQFVEEHDAFGLHVDFSDETEALLETGGAIKKAAPLLVQGREACEVPFLIHNVDIISNIDLRAFCSDDALCNAATLLVSKRPSKRQLLFNEDNHLVGWLNTETGQIKSPYEDLDLSCCQQYAFSGIHLFSPALFPYFKEWPDKFSIVDFYLSVCDKENIYAYPDSNLKLMDVGKLDTLLKADEFLRNECC